MNGNGKPAKKEDARARRAARDDIGDAERQIIAEMLLQRIPVATIAKHLGRSRRAVTYHIRHHIRPIWREAMREDIHRTMAGIDYLERVAWDRFHASLQPETREQMEAELLADGVSRGLSELATKRTYTRVSKNGEIGWLHVVQWCHEFRAKVYGSFAPEKHQVSVTDELRVAGRSPAELDTEMLERLRRKMAEREAYERALQANQN